MWLVSAISEAMGLPCLLFLLSSLYYSCSCQVTIPSTDPPVTTNGETVDLPAVENATNVCVFCEFSTATVWQLGRNGMPPDLIDFDDPEFSNFKLENISTYTNLTILLFTKDLSTIVLECTNGFQLSKINAFFIPRFIGLFIAK